VSQLAKGVRYFDLQITFVNGKPYFSKGGFIWDTDVLSEMQQVGQFIGYRPGEFVILKFSYLYAPNESEVTELNLVAGFARTVVAAIGQHRIATQTDDPAKQTYRTQCIERKRNVMIIFDKPNGQWVHAMPPQITISGNSVMRIKYDPSVGKNDLIGKLDLRGRVYSTIVNEFDTNEARECFRNIHYHFVQPRLHPNLPVIVPDNMDIATDVIKLATGYIGIAIVTFDMYTVEVTTLIIIANQNRVQLLKRMVWDPMAGSGSGFVHFSVHDT
jgi:hypothetical protein